MDLSPIFKVVFKKDDKGKIYPSIINRNAYDLHMCQFKEGDYGELVIRNPTRYVKGSIRKYYFKVVVGLMADYTGDTPEAEHERIKEKFCVRDMFKEGARVSDKDKIEFVEKVKAYMWHDHGIVVPGGDEVDY